MTRVGRYSPVQLLQPVHLYAARNEYEAFQVIVSAQDGDLQGVRATLSPLRGDAGEIAAASASLYRAHYVQVLTPSPLAPLEPDWVADALIPFSDPTTGAPVSGGKYAAMPFTVAAGENQPLWVDLYVPTATPPGNYEGVLTVTATGQPPQEVPVSLTVWNFTLPKTPYQRSSFGFSPQVLRYYYEIDRAQEAAREQLLLQAYSLFLIEHRLMPGTLPIMNFNLAENGEIHFSTAPVPGLNVTPQAVLSHYLNGLGVNSVQLPLSESWPFDDALGADRERVKRYLGDLAHHLHSQNAETLLYVYPVDEPHTVEAYQAVRAWAALLDETNQEYGVDIRFLLTEQPAARESEWGDLNGSVNIWVPCCGTVWRDLHAVNASHAIAERLAHDDEIWWYTALVQQSDEWMDEQGWPATLTANYSPVWLLDYPPINYRIPSWLNHRYGFTGLLYWATNHWLYTPDVWTDPATYGTGGVQYNGEGLLIYPGEMATVGFEGPVPSMRLKWLRDGMEDYDYLQLLKEQGETAFALDQLDRVARAMDDWELDPQPLYKARQRMGERLDTLFTGVNG
jgi:hypothetical protein